LKKEVENEAFFIDNQIGNENRIIKSTERTE
jgi:hypothetical protein